MLTATQRVIALAFILAATTATNSLAQETAPDPDAPETMGAGTMPEQGPGSALQQAQDAPIEQPDMTGQGMMCSEMCAGMGEQGRAGGMMQHGLMDHGRMGESQTPHGTMGSMMGAGMHDHAMRIGFALADANGDGGLSLDEVADMQARIFQAIDMDDDGRVTPEELQGFMHQ